MMRQKGRETEQSSTFRLERPRVIGGWVNLHWGEGRRLTHTHRNSKTQGKENIERKERKGKQRQGKENKTSSEKKGKENTTEKRKGKENTTGKRKGKEKKTGKGKERKESKTKQRK